MERETGIEPATNSLEGCDSTTELLPPKTSCQLSAVSPQQNLTATTNFLEPMIRIKNELMTAFFFVAATLRCRNTYQGSVLPTDLYRPLFFPDTLEPMIRIELMTSPLPRECSTN
jgi:hypothetical protein